MQHHRAHIASVLAERSEWTTRVAGVSFDGTGYGDDGSIWGGEIFVGSLREGFDRVAHLRQAALAGGDAAAESPVQAAAGFLAQLDDAADFTAAPFFFPARYRKASELIRKGVRTFATTSMGAFLMPQLRWLDSLAKSPSKARPRCGSNNWLAPPLRKLPIRFLSMARNSISARYFSAVIEDRIRGRDIREIARAFHRGIAQGLHQGLKRDLSAPRFGHDRAVGRSFPE